MESMIIDYRSYTLKTGTVPEFFDLFENQGLDVQKRVLGNFVGMFRTEFGNLNEVIHLWGYESLAERERRRAELFKEATFNEFAGKAHELVVSQEARILTSAPFSPI